MGTLTTITEPTEEPVRLEDVKSTLIIEDDSEDSRILGIIRASRKFAEDYCKLKLISQVVELSFDSWPSSEICLGVWPIISIDSVKYDDTSSPITEQTLVEGVDYYADTTTIKGRIRTVSGWPSVAVKPNAIRIRMTVGYADQESVPDQIKEGIKAYCAYLYDSDKMLLDSTKELLWSAKIM